MALKFHKEETVQRRWTWYFFSAEDKHADKDDEDDEEDNRKEGVVEE